jgi:hypothetical protein
MPSASILLRQEEGDGGAVGFGDDPDASAVPERVRGQQATAVLERPLVLLAVVIVQLPLVADGTRICRSFDA